jgi:ubiquinone/menaquinone biosynthesis C-methylase UbiE
MKKFDYEKKISGIQQQSSFEFFKPEISRLVPNEFKNIKGKILDVGCGAGNYTATLKRCCSQSKVYGVDLSKRAIKRAKKDFPSIHFSVAKATHLPFPDHSFDALVMKCVLEHLKDPAKVLAEVKRVLKPGGLFYSITPLEGDKLVLSPPLRLTKKYHGHLQKFSRHSLISLLEKNGFQIKRHYFFGFLLCQIINFLYHFLWDLFNFPPDFSIQSYLDKEGRSLSKSLLFCLSKIVTFLLNIESLIIPNKLPGYYMNIVAYKGKAQLNDRFFYSLTSSFANRKFFHYFYALKSLKGTRGADSTGSPLKVLDVGCNVGSLTSEIKKSRPDLEITACDNQKENLQYFKRHFNKGIKIIYGDAHHLPFNNSSFNALLMFDVLEHLDKPKKAIGEINRVLKKRGIFHLSVPCEKSLATWDGWLYRLFKRNLKQKTAGHSQLFTVEEIKKMLKNQDFKVIDLYFSQHFLDQFFSLFFYLYVWIFRQGRFFNLQQKSKRLPILASTIRIGAWLGNLESAFLKKVRGRTAHITSRKIQ